MADKKRRTQKLKKGEIYREKVNSQQGYEDWEFIGNTMQHPTLGKLYGMKNDRGVQWFDEKEIKAFKRLIKKGEKNMADKKKKKQTAKHSTGAKKSEKLTKAKSKPAAKKPAAKKAVAKTTPKRTVKATKAAKPKTAPKKVTKKPETKVNKKATKPKALKPDWDFENEKPKRSRSNKEQINIIIPQKSKASTKAQNSRAKSVTKQVTEQLPDNARLRTIHLHFKID